MDQVLIFAQDAGLSSYDFAQPVADPFLYLLNTLNKLDKEFFELEHELAVTKWHAETLDISTITNLTQKTKYINNIVAHIDDILQGKEILQAQLYQQFSNQNQLPLDRALQKPFKEMMIGLTEIVNNFSVYTEAIKTVKQFSLDDNILELGFQSIKSLFEKCQQHHQALTAIVSTVKKMQANTIKS